MMPRPIFVLCLLVAVFMAINSVSCSSAQFRGTTGWSFVEPGTTVIETVCSYVIIEVRRIGEEGALVWRVSVVPRVTPLPTKPEKGAPVA